MSIDISAPVTCTRCGKQFGTAKSHFHTSYATSYKGVRHLPICKDCVGYLFDTYYEQSKDYRLTVKQLCRKFDLYWNEDLFATAMAKSTPRTLFSSYMSAINNPSFAGRCYDHTLAESGIKWWEETACVVEDDDEEEEIFISDEVRAFWGSGLDPKAYQLLEERMNYIIKKLNLSREDLDVGTELILKQTCGLELDIAAARAEGKPVDKLVNSFNTLMGSLNIKPAQQKSETTKNSTIPPLGVMAKIVENKHPIDEVSPDLRDIDKIFETTTTFMFGHTSKMLQQNNVYSRAYDEVMDRYRITNDMVDADDDDVIEAMLSERDDDE